MTTIPSDVPKDQSNNCISKFAIGKNLCQNIRRIGLRVHVGRKKKFLHGNNFTDAVASNQIAFLLQNRLRNLNVCDDRHVVTEKEGRTTNWNTEHS
jgi:hypothetical protein